MCFAHEHHQRNRYFHWSPPRDAVPAGPGFEIPNRRPTTLIMIPRVSQIDLAAPLSTIRAERPTTFAEEYTRREFPYVLVQPYHITINIRSALGRVAAARAQFSL
jgi:hypothetical protein